jgi:hypothetical protein
MKLNSQLTQVLKYKIEKKLITKNPESTRLTRKTHDSDLETEISS